MKCHVVFRYVYFLLSSFKVQSFAAWRADGEPNPFWRIPRRRRVSTSRQEIGDIFEEHGVGWSSRRRRRMIAHDRAA